MASAGRCYACATPYGVFRKEVGCRNCGFSFCGRCVTKKMPLKKLGNECHQVCDKCHGILSGEIPIQMEPRSLSPPRNFIKRLQMLGVDKGSGHAGLKQPSKGVDAVQGKRIPCASSSADEEIRDRLQKLKEKPVSYSDNTEPATGKVAGPTDDELRRRLLALQGRKHLTPEGGGNVQLHKPWKPESQQTEELLTEICHKVELENRLKELTPRAVASTSVMPNSEEGHSLDSISMLIAETAQEMELEEVRACENLQKDKELWHRLSILKEEKKDESKVERTTSGVVGKAENDENDDEDEDIKCSEKQILEEMRIDEKVIAEGYSSLMNKSQKKGKANKEVLQRKQEAGSDSSSEELPWCCLCTDDAAVRCPECDGDLYCMACFKRSHTTRDLRAHAFVPYSTQ